MPQFVASINMSQKLRKDSPRKKPIHVNSDKNFWKKKFDFWIFLNIMMG